MSDKYKVAVHGLMKKNGQMAKFGDEVVDDVHVDEAAKKVKQGYLLPSDEFDAARKKETDELAASKITPEQKAQAEKDQAEAESKKKKADNA